MKTLILFLSLTWMALAQPYEAGRIRDKSGQAYLRQKPVLGSPVLSKIANGNFVLILSRQGDYYNVLKLQPISGRPDSFGYVHVTKVKSSVTGALGAGCVKDQLSWCKLHSSASLTGPVLRKMGKYDWFVILEKGPFDKVMTRNGQIGYIHASRVQWILPKT